MKFVKKGAYVSVNKFSANPSSPYSCSEIGSKIFYRCFEVDDVGVCRRQTRPGRPAVPACFSPGPWLSKAPAKYRLPPMPPPPCSARSPAPPRADFLLVKSTVYPRLLPWASEWVRCAKAGIFEWAANRAPIPCQAHEMGPDARKQRILAGA